MGGINRSKVITFGEVMFRFNPEGFLRIAQATPEDFDWKTIFDGAEWFHFTGITPALSENMAEAYH